MATVHLRLATTLVNNFGELIEANQTAATTATGWTVAKNGVALSSEMDAGVEQAGGTFSANGTTPKPSGLITGTTANALRSSNPITGIFAATAWSVQITWRSVTAAHTGTLRARARVYKGPNADGSGATELTGSTQVGGTSAAGSTTADSGSLVNWTPAAPITFNNEYLFIAVALEVVTASGSNSADALLRTAQNVGTGTYILTSNLTTLDSATITLTLTPGGSEGLQTQDSNTLRLVLIPSATEGIEYRDVTYVEGPEYHGRLQDMSSISVSNPNTARVEKVVMPRAGVFRKLTLYLQKQGTPTDNYVIKLCPDDGAGSPNLAAAYETWTDAAANLTTSIAAYTFTPSNYDSLPAGTLWIVIYRTNATTDSVNNFSVGDEFFSTYDPGFESNWVMSGINGPPSDLDNEDLYFLLEYVATGAQPRLSLTPSGTDQYTAGSGGVEYLDSATALLALTPSAVEEHVTADAATVTLTLTPSGTDTQQDVDANTVSVALTPSSAEEHTTFDSAATLLALVPSGSEVQADVDANTVPVLLTPSSIELLAAVDSNTTLLALTPSGTDQQTGSTADAGTGVVALIPSGTDVQQDVDTAVVLVLLIPSGTEEHTTYDADTTRLGLVPSSSDIAQFSDATTVPVVLVPSGTDAQQGADATTANLRFAPSGTDVQLATDAATSTVALIPSGTDSFAGAASDADTIRLILTTTSTDVLAGIDSSTGTLVLTPSGTENKQTEYTEAATGTLKLSPGTSDTPQYVEGGTVSLNLTPLGTDALQGMDDALVPLRFTPSGADILPVSDFATTTLNLSPSGFETATLVEDVIVNFILTPSSVEERIVEDIGEVYLHLTVLVAPAIQYMVTGVAYLRWMATSVPRWSITSRGSRWSIRPSLARWTARSYKRYAGQ